MTIREKMPAADAGPTRAAALFGLYERALSGVLMLLGFRQWAIILGLIAGSAGMFETMATGWQIETAHFAVVDLVASVGLWMRVAWGNVVWIYAALSEIIIHTLFSDTFGFDFPIVAFHLLTIATFAALALLARRNPA